MARSLKEALLDQFALLQERGLAPSEVPPEEERPLVIVESAPRGRSSRRRDFADRFGEGDDALADVSGQFDRDRRRPDRRDMREEGRGERRRAPRPVQRGRGRPEEEAGTLQPLVERPFGRGPRPPMGTGPRPPFRPGMVGPRPGGMAGVRPPVSRTAMMQQRAEQRRRDDEDIAEMRQLLAQYSGVSPDEVEMDDFSRALMQETGALPPPGVVVAAIKSSESADPRQIADAVRAHYRRPRGRPAGVGPARVPAVAASA